MFGFSIQMDRFSLNHINQISNFTIQTTTIQTTPFKPYNLNTNLSQFKLTFSLYGLNYAQLSFFKSHSKWQKKCNANLRRCKRPTLNICYAKYVQERADEYRSYGKAACVYALNCMKPFEAASENTDTLQEALMIEFPNTIANLLITGERGNDINNTDSALIDSRHQAVEWPPIFDNKYVIKCMRNYWINSKYKTPKICALCTRAKQGASLRRVEINDDTYKQLNLNLLKIEDQFIYNNCIQNISARALSIKVS